MKFDNLTTELYDDIFIITINRPKQLNALNRITLLEFEEAIMMAYENNHIKGIIITGSGNKAFVAGADIKEFASYSKKQGKEMVINGQRILKIVEDCPKPIIAAINGFALGGGCELAMACHIRIASENAKFGQPEVKLGIIPGYGGTQRIIQLIGKSKAFELLMTGESIDAKEAKRIGLITHVTTLDDIVPKAIGILKIILNNSPIAIQSIIKTVNAYFSEEINGFKSEIEGFTRCISTNDFVEGTKAFVEKRKPRFSGN